LTFLGTLRLWCDVIGAGPGLPMPCRRTFAAAILAFALCMLAALRHPWLRWPASPAPLARAAPDLPVGQDDVPPPKSPERERGDAGLERDRASDFSSTHAGTQQRKRESVG